jgi:hypothetical protein
VTQQDQKERPKEQKANRTFRLYARLIKAGVRIIRRSYNHIGDLISEFPKATAVFNCTGLGARHLGGVEDERVHPTKVCLPPEV